LMRGAHRLPCRAYPDQRVFLDQGSFGKAGSAEAGGVESVDSDSSLRVSVAPPHTYGVAGSRRTERDIG
jgi:hypothetical protein